MQVIELFKAADKYDVLGLVQECVARFRQVTGANEIAPLLQVSPNLRSMHQQASIELQIAKSHIGAFCRHAQDEVLCVRSHRCVCGYHNVGRVGDATWAPCASDEFVSRVMLADEARLR